MTDAFFEEKLNELKHISDEYIDHVMDTVDDDSDDLLNWDILCWEFHNLGMISDALEIIDHAIEINHEVSEFWTTKGVILFDLIDIGGAIECFKTSLKLDPTESVVWEYLSLALNLVGDYPVALDAINKAIEINPKDSKFWFYKGENLLDMNRFQEAVESINTGLELDPRDYDAWCKLVYSYYGMGDYENALDTANYILKLEPDDSVMLEFKSIILSDIEKSGEQSYDVLLKGKTYRGSTLDDFK